MGLKESTSLWVETPIGVRLPTAGSPDPAKAGPTLGVVVFLLCRNCRLSFNNAQLPLRAPNYWQVNRFSDLFLMSNNDM